MRHSGDHGLRVTGEGVGVVQPTLIKARKALRRTVAPARGVPVTLRTRIATICFAVALLHVATDAGFGCANAQERLEATYTATLLGAPIGNVFWTIDVRQNEFSASPSGGTSGLLHVFDDGRGTGAAHGAVSAGQPIASTFSISMFSGDWSEQLQVLFSGGKAKEHFFSEPPPPNPDLVPLTEAHRTGVVDPITALLIRIPGGGDVFVPEACERTLAIFDGHTRYDLTLAFKRLDNVKTDEGYQGTVVVCSVRFFPLAGYDPDRVLIKYLAEQPDIEMWLAPLADSRLLVPYRISIPTPIGLGVVQATRFVAAANPARRRANGWIGGTLSRSETPTPPRP
ncbi:MAG TPA: DUF3108 domain-containing protein [Xanthobacteraceae bacterium]|nr:DUF3108 domain-containing protein [Xanthobacteraceae bacterium]